MRRVLLIVLASVVAVAVAWYLAGLPGHVTAQFGSWTFEAATPIVVLALFVLFLILYAALRVLGGIVHLPRSVAFWRKQRHRRAGDEAITRALIAIAAGGGGGDARRQAQRARQMLGDTPQTLLLAAEANRLAGRDDEAALMFRALSERKDAAFLGLRGLLRQAIEKQDWVEAAALARQADAAHPGAGWLRQERAQLAIRAGNWAEALELSATEAPKAALGAAAANDERDPDKARRMARQAWKRDPALAPTALAYARRLRGSNHESRAVSVITDTWKLAPHPDLATFLLEPISDKLARVQAAQKLTATNLDQPESRMLLARTTLDAGLTGEARRHLEAAQAAGLNERRLWLLLAELEEEERGDTEAGRQAQRDALRRAATADPDATWRCTSCNTAHATWSPACPACATPGSLRWGARAAATTAAVATVPS